MIYAGSCRSDAKGTGGLGQFSLLDSSGFLFQQRGQISLFTRSLHYAKRLGDQFCKRILQWAVNSRDKGAAVRVDQFLGNFCIYGHIRNNFLDRRERLIRFFWINCYRGQFWKTAAGCFWGQFLLVLMLWWQSWSFVLGFSRLVLWSKTGSILAGKPEGAGLSFCHRVLNSNKW